MKNKYKVLPSGIKSISVRAKSTSNKIRISQLAFDADGPNELAESLGVKFNLGDTNLNKKWSREGFNTITSFEVLEHLQNPLLYLQCIYNALNYDGKLFLTTPIKWIFKGKYHFHEYTKDELIHILLQAGFVGIRVSRMQAYNLKHFGIRPLIKKIRDKLLGQCFFVIAFKKF